MTRHQSNQAHRRLARPRGFTYIDVIVLICCLGLGILVGCFTRGRSTATANRVKCASNLRQIGQALLLYANDNGGHYPRVIYVAGLDTKPTWGTGAGGKNPFVDVEPNDVSAAMFLLLRTQDITPEVFTCPSSNADRDTLGGGANAPIDRANFTDVKKNLSYSMHNPYVRDGVVPDDDKTYWTTNMSADFAIAADINPGTGPGADDDVLKPNAKSSFREMRLANSSNHEKDGQNILYGDGHVSWEASPFVGVRQDNIYTTKENRVIASPTDVHDSVLLPTDD
jgi:prepilin-type processing-associated H-X9-DG protein